MDNVLDGTFDESLVGNDLNDAAVEEAVANLSVTSKKKTKAQLQAEVVKLRCKVSKLNKRNRRLTDQLFSCQSKLSNVLKSSNKKSRNDSDCTKDLCNVSVSPSRANCIVPSLLSCVNNPQGDEIVLSNLSSVQCTKTVPSASLNGTKSPESNSDNISYPGVVNDGDVVNDLIGLSDLSQNGCNSFVEPLTGILNPLLTDTVSVARNSGLSEPVNLVPKSSCNERFDEYQRTIISENSEAIVLGDSLLKGLWHVLRGMKTKVNCFPGISVEQLCDLLNVTESNEGVRLVVLHVGSNNLRNTQLDYIVGELWNVVEQTKKVFPRAKIVISAVLMRRDVPFRRVSLLNREIAWMCGRLNIGFIDCNSLGLSQCLKKRMGSI